MKDPSSFPRRSKRSKLKLLVSFNGTFCRRPPSKRFRYTGGETRFISVDRSIHFSKLKSKITDLIRPNGGDLTRFSLKYHVSESSSSSSSAGGGVVDREEEPQMILISLESDDDVRCMVEEYEMVQLRGLSLTRLWVFVCDNSSDDNGFVNKHALLSQDGDGFCEGRKVFAENMSRQLGRTNDSNRGVATNTTAIKKFNDDYSLRKMVLKQQLLSKKLDEISSFRGIVEQSEMELNSENEDCEAPSMESSCPESDSPSIFVPKDVNFGDVLCVKVTDYDKYVNAHKMANENVGKVLPVIESNSRPLIPKDGNLGPRFDVFEGGLSGQTCTVFVNGRGNPVEGDMAYDGACTGAYHKFSLAIDAVLSSLPNTRAVDAQMDLLTGPGSEKLDIGCQAVDVKALDKVGMNAEAPFHINQEVHLHNQEEVIISGSGSPYNLSCSSGTELSCNRTPLDTESGHGSNNYRSCAHTLDNHSASTVDLSLHNLSLASSRMLQLPSSSSTGVDKSESLLKLQSKDLDLIDEEHLYSGPIVEKYSDTASTSSPDVVERRENNDNETQENQKNLDTNLSIVEKNENKKTNKCLKVDGDFPADIAAFYTHLASRELQNIKNSDLECIKELGSGNFGTVYYGKWKGSDVAIKRIKPSCFTDGGKPEDRLVADFWKEAHILRQLHHPNIVALYGVVTDGPVNSLATVTEYMVNGSLKQVLRRKDRTIDRRKRLIIAMDAAFGMEYLHEKNIVHFDLKSHNFLMNTRDPQRPICKIGDLGLSKIKQRTLVSGGVRGTIPWMAPELLSGKNLVSDKVDVYSFAIVMWELLSGEEPYADMRSEEIIAGIIRGNLRPEIPSWCDPAWRSLMERCWSSDPDSRPPFSEIAKELRAMAAAMNIK